MYEASVPVTASSFFDRVEALARIEEAISKLERGAPEWLAIIGPRKIGKTSLLLEASRRSTRDVHIVIQDVMEDAPVSGFFFRKHVIRCLDALFGAEAGTSLVDAAVLPKGLRDALMDSESFRSLAPSLQKLAFGIEDLPVNEPSTWRLFLDLPHRITKALDRHMLVAIDEFQELAAIASKKKSTDPFALMRSVWQKHDRLAYVISGSAMTMLQELVTSKHSPFFQHFAMLQVPPFSDTDAIRLLVDNSPKGKKINKKLARQVVDVVGGHPFYLQLAGNALVQHAPYDEDSPKLAFQDLIFSRIGRLSLYFQREHQRLVGRASGLAAVLNTVADSPKRLTDIAKTVGVAPGTCSHYIDRLGDAIHKREDGLYTLTDPTFALWLKWRQPGGSALPMKILGDEGEAAAAKVLASMGFDLIYQSRASRGAFDLLALRGATQLGVQVKRRALPLRFTKTEWNRMEADAARLGWRWLIAAVSEGEVLFLDPAGSKKGKTIAVSKSAKIDNVLRWLDTKQPHA